MSDEEPEELAPVFEVPDREVVAVEHPMIIHNVDNAIKTFGTNRPFLRILDSADPEQCVPLYLRYNDPMCVPILSHNSPTNNVLLKITVPKRTGRKRKRGSNDAFTYGQTSTEEVINGVHQNGDGELWSRYEMDRPSLLFRKIADNEDTYRVEAVAEIRQTHRYRGLSDFHHSTSHTEFIPKFKDQIIGGDVLKLREFKFNPSRGWKPNEEFMPGPKMTNHTIPQNWGWHQNSNIHHEIEANTGKNVLINRSKPKKVQVSYLRFDVSSVPQESPFEVPEDSRMQEIIAELRKAFDERPIWSRRALHNHLARSRVRHLMKAGLQYVGYQFKGGPFRECVVKYGLDPRPDPQYRKYQTIFLKIYEDQRNTGVAWHDMRSAYSLSRQAAKGPIDGHLFDGKRVTLDGKAWQLCDISDPLLASLIENSPYAKTFEISADGWYLNGSMAKIRGIMRAKVMAIWRKKDIKDADFAAALNIPDEVPNRKSAQIQVPLPIDEVSAEEMERLAEKGVPSVVDEKGFSRRVHKGKMRAQRIRPRVRSRKEDIRWTRKAKIRRSHYVLAKEKAGAMATGSSDKPATDGNLHGPEAVGVHENENSMLEGSDQDDEGDTDLEDEEEEEDDDDDDDDDDEDDDDEGLEDIPDPVLRRPSQEATSGTTTPASRQSSAKPGRGRPSSSNSKLIKSTPRKSPSESGRVTG